MEKTNNRLYSLTELISKKIKNKAESIEISLDLKETLFLRTECHISMHLQIIRTNHVVNLVIVTEYDDYIEISLPQYKDSLPISKDGKYNLNDIEIISDLASQLATSIKIHADKINKEIRGDGTKLRAVVSGIKKQMYG